MDMGIRRLLPADAAAYRELRLRGLREHPEAFTSSWEEDVQQPIAASRSRLESPQQDFWGAFEQRSLCGMVGLERRTRAKERHKGTVVGMYVAPECAGRGLGDALMEPLLEHARAQGLQQLVLTVTEGNGAALRVYQRAGFRVFGTEARAVRLDGRFLAKVHMHLEL